MAACWKELNKHARGRLLWSVFWGILAALAGFFTLIMSSGNINDDGMISSVVFFGAVCLICLLLCAYYGGQRKKIRKKLDSALELENSGDEGQTVGRITVGDRAAYIRPARMFIFYQDIKWVVRRGKRTDFYMRYGVGKMKLDNKLLTQEEFEGLCKCMAAETEILFGNTRQNRAAYRAYKKCCDSYLIG